MTVVRTALGVMSVGDTGVKGDTGSTGATGPTGPTWTPTTGATAPAAGAHVVGEIVYHSAPEAAGNIGWVCVTAGTPGTWKTFGTIEA